MYAEPARNFIFDKKYTSRDIGKYRRLEPPSAHSTASSHLLGDGEEYFSGLQSRFSRHMHRFLGDDEEQPQRRPLRQSEGAHIQLARSCCQWSVGVSTEHSIANAYIEAITNARHFVYIENQVRPFS